MNLQRILAELRTDMLNTRSRYSLILLHLCSPDDLFNGPSTCIQAILHGHVRLAGDVTIAL